MAQIMPRGAGASEAIGGDGPDNGKPSLGRRTLLSRGGVLAAGVVGAGALTTAAASPASAQSSGYQYIPVAAPLPSGDTSGATDTPALNNALAALSGREALLLTVPGYYINAPLSVLSETGLTAPVGYGIGSTPHITAASGFSGAAMIANHGWLNGSQSGDDGIEISNLFINGSNGGTSGPFVSTNGHGIALSTSHAHVHHNYVNNVSGTGIFMADQNSAGQPIDSGSTQENYIWDNKVANPGQWCIWVSRTAGSIGMTDGVLARNIIIDPSFGGYYVTGNGNPQINPATNAPYEAMRLDNGAGWWVTDNHAYYCPGGAYFFGAFFGTHFRDNTCDMFGTFPWSIVSGTLTPATIIGAALHGVKCNINPIGSAINYQHPSSAVGNLLNVYEGVNKAGTIAPGTGTSSSGCRYHYYDIAADTLSVPAGATGECGLVFLANLANQNSVGGQTVASCTTTSGSATVTASGGSFANVQQGMSVTGTGIPASTYVGTVVTGSADSLTLVTSNLTTAVDATASGTVTLTFPGPYSLAEQWAASTAGVTLNAQHLGNRAFGSITAKPTIATSNGAVVNLLAELGGVVISGTPSSGQVPIATSASAAAWGSVSASISGVTISGTASLGQVPVATSSSAGTWSGTRGMLKGVASLTPGVSGSQGTPVTISAPAGAVGMDAVAFQWIPKGVSSETITLQVTVTFNDTTTATISPSATGSATTQSSSGNQIVGLAKNGCYVTSASVSAASSASSTSATPSFTLVAVPVA
jgi:hypothetical protein